MTSKKSASAKTKMTKAAGKGPKSYDTRDAKNRKLTRKDVRKAAKRYSNWGRWGKSDEIGTLNFTTPEDIVAAAQLVKKGKVISLALNYDQHGPQGAKSKYPALGRFNPIHLMTRTGTDAYSGVLDHRNIRGTDDIIIMPLQCGTQWDGLGHIMYERPYVERLRLPQRDQCGGAKSRHREDEGKNDRTRRVARRRARDGTRVLAGRIRDHERDPRLHR